MPKNHPQQSHQCVPYEIAVGDHLPGHDSYTNEGLLGRGGMGSVYRMVRGQLAFEVAVKIMHRDLASRPEFVKLFLEEARILKQVGEHVNLVRILDYATLSDGVPFIVMELLEGRALGSSIRAHALSKTSLDRGASLQIVHEICAGVFELHCQGIVHRDMKPDNVFLQRRLTAGPDGAVKILDCGLAYKQEMPFQKGILQGTPKYMAPEQVRGDEVSPQTDQYAIALILCEMLLGRLPFNLPPGASVQQLLDAHLWLPPLPLSQFLDWISPTASDTVLAALDKDPAKRLRSVFEFQTRIYVEAERLRSGRAPDVGTAGDENITTPTPMTFEDPGPPADHARGDPLNRTQPLLLKETMRMETAPTHPVAAGVWLPPAAPIAAPFAQAVAVPPVGLAPAPIQRRPDPQPWSPQHVVTGSPVPQPVAAARSETAAQSAREAWPFDARSSQPKAPTTASSPDTSTGRSLSYEPPNVDADSHAMGRALRRRVLVRWTVAAAGLAMSGLLLVAVLHLGSNPARSAAASAPSIGVVPPVAPAVAPVVPSASALPAPAATVGSSSSPVIPPPAAVSGSGYAPLAASPNAVPLPAPGVPPAASAAKVATPRSTPVRATPKPASSDGSDELFRPLPGH